MPFATRSQFTLSTGFNHFTLDPDFCISLAFLLPLCNREKGTHTHTQHKGEPLCSHICHLDFFNRPTPIAQMSLDRLGWSQKLSRVGLIPTWKRNPNWAWSPREEEEGILSSQRGNPLSINHVAKEVKDCSLSAH